MRGNSSKEPHVSDKSKLILIKLGCKAVTATINLLLCAFGVWLIYNATLPDLIGRPLTFVQALGLAAVCDLLFNREEAVTITWNE